MCERHHGGGIGLFVLGVVVGSVIAHKRMLHGGFGHRPWGPPGEGGPEGGPGPHGPWAHHGGAEFRVPPMIQELHRRMHEQDKETPAKDTPAQA